MKIGIARCTSRVLKIFMTCLLGIFPVNLFGQTTLQTVDFETTSGYTVTGGQTTTSDDWWERATAAQVTPTDPFTVYQGSYFFYAEDTDNGRATDEPCYCTLNSIDVSSYTNLQIKILVAGNNNSGSAYEQEEYLRIQYAYDGGSFTTLAQFIAANVNDDYMSEDADADGTAEGPALSPAFAEFTYNIPSSGSSLQIRIMGSADQANEEFGFDNIRVSGTDVSLPVELSSFSAQSEGKTIVLEWVTESEKDNLGFVLERSQDKTFWTTIASYKTHVDLQGQGDTSSRTEYSFTDKTIASEANYTYRLSDVSIEGKKNVVASTSVQVEALPTTTQLFAAYPNPFNPSTTVRYQLSKETDVEISVYNTLGSHIKTLYCSHQSAGSYQVDWNGTDEAGNNIPTGTYLIRMQTGQGTQTQKVLLVK